MINPRARYIYYAYIGLYMPISWGALIYMPIYIVFVFFFEGLMGIYDRREVFGGIFTGIIATAKRGVHGVSCLRLVGCETWQVEVVVVSNLERNSCGMLDGRIFIDIYNILFCVVSSWSGCFDVFRWPRPMMGNPSLPL